MVFCEAEDLAHVHEPALVALLVEVLLSHRSYRVHVPVEKRLEQLRVLSKPKIDLDFVALLLVPVDVDQLHGRHELPQLQPGRRQAFPLVQDHHVPLLLLRVPLQRLVFATPPFALGALDALGSGLDAELQLTLLERLPQLLALALLPELADLRVEVLLERLFLLPLGCCSDPCERPRVLGRLGQGGHFYVLLAQEVVVGQRLERQPLVRGQGRLRFGAPREEMLVLQVHGVVVIYRV